MCGFFTGGFKVVVQIIFSLVARRSMLVPCHHKVGFKRAVSTNVLSDGVLLGVFFLLLLIAVVFSKVKFEKECQIGLVIAMFAVIGFNGVSSTGKILRRIVSFGVVVHKINPCRNVRA